MSLHGDAVSFQYFSNWHETCIFKGASAGERWPNLRSDSDGNSVRQRSRDLQGVESGHEVTFSDGVRHRRTRWTKVPPKGKSRGFEKLSKAGQKRTSEIGMVNKCAVFATMLCAAALSSTPHLQAQQSTVKTIVLVHGTWADGSAGKASTTFLSRTPSMSASSKSRRRPSKMM